VHIKLDERRCRLVFLRHTPSRLPVVILRKALLVILTPVSQLLHSKPPKLSGFFP